MIEPMLTAPIYIGEPRCPITALSTRPTKGIVIFERIKGRAIVRVFLSELDRFNLKKDTSTTNFYHIKIIL